MLASLCETLALSARDKWAAATFLVDLLGLTAQPAKRTPHKAAAVRSLPRAVSDNTLSQFHLITLSRAARAGLRFKKDNRQSRGAWALAATIPPETASTRCHPPRRRKNFARFCFQAPLMGARERPSNISWMPN
jgi:hypothetical protein